MNTLETLSETAYSWAVLPENLPKENLVLITAKTTAPTKHTDTKWHKRKFSTQELHEAARSLGYRPINDTHRKEDIKDALVIDAQWNETTQSVEALIYLPNNYIDFIKREKALGRDVKYSVEYSWRDEKYDAKDDSTEFVGLIFRKIAIIVPEHLPEGFTVGDVATTSTLAEDYFNKRGLMEMAQVEGKEESKIDFNKTIEGLNLARETALKEKTVAEEKLSAECKHALELSTAVETLTKEKEELTKKLSAVEKENKDNIDAVVKLQGTVANSNKEKEQAIVKAKEEIKKAVITKISSVAPNPNGYVKNAHVRAVAIDIDRALREVNNI